MKMKKEVQVILCMVAILATVFCSNSMTYSALSQPSTHSASEFAARAEVAVPPGVSMARASLPKALIAALRSNEAADLRVFNAAGVAVPFALLTESAVATPVAEAGVRLPALPIYATESTAAVTPALRVVDGASNRVIEIAGSPAPANRAMEKLPRGLLFDTRLLRQATHSLTLEGAIPPGVILNLTFDASSDLKNWSPLVTVQPVFDYGGTDPVNRTVELPAGTVLEGRFLRLTWAQQDTPPALTAVTANAAPPEAKVAPVVLELGAPMMVDATHAEWTLPSYFRVSALRLQTTAPNALMPIRIQTRNLGESWRSVTRGVVYRLAASDGVRSNPSIAIPGSLARQVRVESDRGYSLDAVPLTLALEYEPLQVVFVATGEGPFQLATGRAGTASAALPIAVVLPGYQTGAENQLSRYDAELAQVGTTMGSTDSGARFVINGLNFKKAYVLWAMLGLAVMALVVMAIKLLKSAKS